MPPGNQPGTILIQDLRHLRHLILDGVRTDTDPLRQFLRSHRLFGGIAQLGYDLQGSAGHKTAPFPNHSCLYCSKTLPEMQAGNRKCRSELFSPERHFRFWDIIREWLDC